MKKILLKICHYVGFVAGYISAQIIGIFGGSKGVNKIKKKLKIK